MTLTNPLLAGRYELGESLGAGALGMVYRAYDQRLLRQVAVKVLHPQLAEDPEVRVRFGQIARQAAALEHRNIVTILDVDAESDTPHLVMAYVRGRTLRRMLQDDGPLEPAAAARAAEEICGALETGHQAGLLHSGLRPANLLFRESGGLVVTDFGLAAVTGMAAPQYLSPEQAEGGEEEPASDLYALGCCLYAMLVGRPPFTGDVDAVLAKQVSEEPVPPRNLRADVPEALEEVVLTALRKRPEERYATAEDMGAALRAAVRRPVDPDGWGDEPEFRNVRPAVRPLAAGPAALPGGGSVQPWPVAPAGDVTGLRGASAGRRRPPRALLIGGLIAVPLLLVLAFVVPALLVRGQGAATGGAERETTASVPPSPPPEPPLTVPDVIGTNEQAALSILGRAGIQLGDIYQRREPDVPEGQVVAVTPEPGTRVEEGTSADLTLSAGDRAVTTQDLVDVIDLDPAAAGPGALDLRRRLIALDRVTGSARRPAIRALEQLVTDGIAQNQFTPEFGETALEVLRIAT